MKHNADLSPRLMGRAVAICYIIVIASGFDLFSIVGKTVARGDAAAAATYMLSHQRTFLAGFAAATLGAAAYVLVTALWYRLYEPVNRTLSLTAAFFCLTGCAVQTIGLVFHLAPLVVLSNQSYLATFTPEQLQALALVLLTFYVKAYGISLVFFGFYLLLIGYLTLRSTFLPRWLGGLVMLGVGWVTFSYPPFQQAVSRFVVLASVGELLLVIWLLVKGVDEKRWYELDRAGWPERESVAMAKAEV